MIGKEPVNRYNVSLPPEIAEALRTLGSGNMSEGIRRALRGYTAPAGAVWDRPAPGWIDLVRVKP